MSRDDMSIPLIVALVSTAICERFIVAPLTASPTYSNCFKPVLPGVSSTATVNAALAPVAVDCSVKRSPVWSRSTVAVTPAFAALILAATLASVSSSEVMSIETDAFLPSTSLVLSTNGLVAVAPLSPSARTHSPRLMVSLPSPRDVPLATVPEPMVCADAS
ncbi:hypothetical protein D3C71_1537880 [compost metagenome]